MWSLGGTCDAASRHKFDRYLRDSLEHLGYPREPHEVPPSSRDVYSWCFDVESMQVSSLPNVYACGWVCAISNPNPNLPNPNLNPNREASARLGIGVRIGLGLGLGLRRIK